MTDHTTALLDEQVLSQIASSSGDRDTPAEMKLAPGSYLVAFMVDGEGKIAMVMDDRKGTLLAMGYAPEHRVAGMTRSEAAAIGREQAQ